MIGERVTVRIESLPFQRRFKRAGEGKNGEDSPCVEGKEVPVSLVFTREVGRKSGRSHVLQYPVESTSPSCSKIRHLRWPNTNDSGSFTLLFLLHGIKLLTQFGFSVSQKVRFTVSE